MPAFIRYPFFGCVILALSACGSSGSSRLLEPAAPAMPDDSEPVSTVQETYSSVDYLITNIPAAIAKFADTEGSGLTQVYKDTDGNKYLLTNDNVTDKDLAGVELPMGVEMLPEFDDLFAVYEDADGNEYLLTPDNVDNMNLEGVELPEGVTEDMAPAFTDLTKVREGESTGATQLASTPSNLDTLRNAIVTFSSRYLSTGAVLARTDAGSVVTERPSAMCEDASATGPAKCAFDMDELREATTFHLGPTSLSGENQVSFRGFRADREPVMRYREALMSQVRALDTGESGLTQVYKDTDGNKYLLTNDNVTDKDLAGVELPMGVEMLPEFDDLFAVYEDADGNEYLLTPDNVDNMNLEGVELPEGVTEDMAPAFTDLTKVREGESVGYEYVGYDGMLRYSMFFVGVYRFFGDEDMDEKMLEHLRFENASLGQIYDENSLESGVQSPSVALTGEGVMVGMERLQEGLEHYLVQGDVNIMYDPLADADDMVDPPVEGMPKIDISITNVQRLTDDNQAWYARENRHSALSWSGVPVMESKFEFTPAMTSDPGRLSGSFYGVEADPEVGGVFHHEDVLYEIIGSFGSKLDPVQDDDDMMDPNQ